MSEGAKEELRAKAEEYWECAWADSSVKVKAAEWKAWLVFCKAYDFEPLTPTEEAFILFATFLSLSMAVSSVEAYVGGVRRLLQLLGANPPSSKNLAVNRIIQGMSRAKGREVDAKEAITPEMLLQIRGLLDWKADEDWLMWGVLMVGFYSFLRPSNLMVRTKEEGGGDRALTWERVTFYEGGVELVCLWSKVIQFRGRMMRIRLASAKGTGLCPVEALWECAKLSQGEDRKGLVFACRRGKGGRTYPFTIAQAAKKLKDWSRKLGWPEGAITLRSLRIGGASWAYRCGVPVEQIKIQGDWASDSWFRYIRRVTVEQSGEVAGAMARGLGQQ